MQAHAYTGNYCTTKTTNGNSRGTNAVARHRSQQQLLSALPVVRCATRQQTVSASATLTGGSARQLLFQQ
jgi:hypothetical protein